MTKRKLGRKDRKKLAAADERVADHRRRVEERLSGLRSALADETGRAPHGKGVLKLVVAATVGLALALRGRTLEERRDAGGE